MSMIRLKPPQWAVFNDDARFRVLVAGRRFGKTYLALVELCKAAWSPGRLAWYVAPTIKQAKRIAWKPLKEMTRPYWRSKPNETDLRIELVAGGTICLRGADNYDSLRGSGLDFLILDEFASFARQVWPEVLRPMLADRQGRALFIGTPRGHDHFYDLHETARNQANWSVFQYTTAQGGNVAAGELESAAREMDERTFRQEFKASFENQTAGLVYYAYDRTANIRKAVFNPRLPVLWALDFNVNPMCSVIGQRDGDRVQVLDEIVLADSNTPAACEEFLRRTAGWKSQYNGAIQLDIYGDATGNGRASSASRTDWQIVKDVLAAKGHGSVRQFHVSSANPTVKDRVNCMNALLRNTVGENRLTIDPRCQQLILDFERVHWKIDPSGNSLDDIDKSDPARTHVSDALGYMVAREFGMRSKGGSMPGILR
jgi:hypothetical protein